MLGPWYALEAMLSPSLKAGWSWQWWLRYSGTADGDGKKMEASVKNTTYARKIMGSYSARSDVYQDACPRLAP
jgi:hypothetical protein